ncbi:hypothetical protein ABPG74_008627 [Tetrahymena malaccensis]
MGQTKSRLNDEAIVLKQEKNLKAFGRVGICETKGTKRPLLACEAKYSEQEPQFYLNLKHPNLVSPLVYDAHFKEFLNLNAQGVTFYFDYLDISLEDIIQSRKVRNSIFPEQEILNVGLAVLTTLQFLKQHNIEGGNIEPATIFYDKGQIKIYNNQLVLGRLACYSMIVNYFQRTPLPSPEVLYSAKKRETELVEKYRYETDIFTLGLSLLEMATLEKSSELFRVDIYQINVKKFDQRLAQIKQRYSDKLVNIIKQMLTMDPRHRPSCESLIGQIRTGVVSVPALGLSKNIGTRSYSLQRSSSGSLNQSFLNASQICGVRTSGIVTQPVVITNSRIASVERRGSLTGGNSLVTPTGSRLVQGQVSNIIQAEKASVQQVQTEHGETHNQTQQPIEHTQNQQAESKENSIRSVPLSHHVQTEAAQIKQIVQKPQIITQNIPSNFLPHQRVSSQAYMTPQTVRYIPAPTFQTANIHQRSIVTPPQQYFSTQQTQQSSKQLPPPLPIQSPPVAVNNTQGIQKQIITQRLQYANPPQGIQSFSVHPQTTPYRQVAAQPFNFTGVQQFKGPIQYSHQVPVSYGYPPYAYPQGFAPLQQQPNISSPQVQREQVQNLLQNHQTEHENRISSLGQKVQELDERVSKSIANSVKVTQQHYNDDKQEEITEHV